MENFAKNIQKLNRLLSLMDEQTLTKEDFTKSFRAVLEYVKKIEAKNIEMMKQIKDACDRFIAKVKQENEGDLSGMRGETEKKISDKMSQMEEMHNLMKQEIDKKLSAVMDGQDGKDADEQKICDMVCEKAQEPILEKLSKLLPSLGGAVRDGLELLQGEDKLNIDAIEGLRELLDELKSRKNVVGGGGAASKWQTGVETPVGTINGVNKSFRVDKYPKWLTIQGQTLYESSGYSISGRTITMDNAPFTGDVLRSHF